MTKEEIKIIEKQVDELLAKLNKESENLEYWLGFTKTIINDKCKECGCITKELTYWRSYNFTAETALPLKKEKRVVSV